MFGALVFAGFAKGELLPWATPAMTSTGTELEIIVNGKHAKDKEHGENGHSEKRLDVDPTELIACIGNDKPD